MPDSPNSVRRQATLAAMVIATPAILAGCQASAPAATRGAILEREQEWAAAMADHDYATLEDILAAEYRLTFVDLIPGRPGKPEVTREMWLDNLRGMTFGDIDMTDQRVTMHGENVAAVRMRMTLHDWRFGDNPIPPDYDLTDIWIHRDGRWQVANRISEPRD